MQEKQVVTLKEFNKYQKDNYYWLFTNRYYLTEKIYDDLILSALGARICYSCEHPLKILFDDKRVSNLEKRIEFLNRLYKMKHFSVFAHSPIFFESIHDLELYKLWKSDCETYCEILDKAFHIKRWHYCGNWRHLVEALYVNNVNFKEFVLNKLKSNEQQKTSMLNVFDKVMWIFVDDNYSDNFKIFDLKENREITKEYLNKGVLCFLLDVKPWLWFSFVVYNFSRVYSHQAVRHTWLNISQRSHRYTKVDDIVIPSSIKPYASLLYCITKTIRFYQQLLKLGIPKEDARYIIPGGAATTIMFSGPLFVWEDFVNKRNIKKAQEEIRIFAKVVKMVIEKYINLSKP